MYRVILYFYCLILLVGCVSIPQNENPSQETTSSYHVYGKHYKVLKTAKNYQERGVASWYGRKFRFKHTSSGERYNMMGMTAAHKTLPFSTYVQVTNLTNNKKVIVKINDRGPFRANRIIDLSYAAAKKLGMLGRGTVNVDVKAVDKPKVTKKHFA